MTRHRPFEDFKWPTDCLTTLLGLLLAVVGGLVMVLWLAIPLIR